MGHDHDHDHDDEHDQDDKHDEDHEHDDEDDEEDMNMMKTMRVFLFRAGTDLTTLDNNGRTPLQLAQVDNTKFML